MENREQKVAKFESDLAGMYNLHDELDTILYAVGDAPVEATEDQLMNMLIGVIELHKTRYDKLWVSWNDICKEHHLGEYESGSGDLGRKYMEKRMNELYKEETNDVNEYEVTLPKGWEKEQDEDNT